MPSFAKTQRASPCTADEFDIFFFSLIVKDKVRTFVQQYPDLLEDVEMPKRKSLIRVKVLNCRRRKREVFYKNLETITK